MRRRCPNGDDVPRQGRGRFADIVFWLGMFILIFWIVKLALGLDPPEWEALLNSVPWVGVAFSAGAVYMKVQTNSRDLGELREDLKMVRDVVNQIKGRMDATG